MLNFFGEISEYISRDTGINKEYIHLTILTIIAILFFLVIIITTNRIESIRQILSNNAND